MVENLSDECLRLTCDEKLKGIWDMRKCVGDSAKQQTLRFRISTFINAIDNNEAGRENH